MKCFACLKELEIIISNYEGSFKSMQCPNSHLQIDMRNNKIIFYIAYWDTDPPIINRYKLIGINDERTTYLHISNKPLELNINYNLNARYAPPKKGWVYENIFSINETIQLPIINDIVHADIIIKRLIKLSAFS